MRIEGCVSSFPLCKLRESASRELAPLYPRDVELPVNTFPIVVKPCVQLWFNDQGGAFRFATRIIVFLVGVQLPHLEAHESRLFFDPALPRKPCLQLLSCALVNSYPVRAYDQESSICFPTTAATITSPETRSARPRRKPPILKSVIASIVMQAPPKVQGAVTIRPNSRAHPGLLIGLGFVPHVEFEQSSALCDCYRNPDALNLC